MSNIDDSKHDPEPTMVFGLPPHLRPAAEALIQSASQKAPDTVDQVFRLVWQVMPHVARKDYEAAAACEDEAKDMVLRLIMDGHPEPRLLAALALSHAQRDFPHHRA